MEACVTSLEKFHTGCGRFQTVGLITAMLTLVSRHSLWVVTATCKWIQYFWRQFWAVKSLIPSPKITFRTFALWQQNRFHGALVGHKAGRGIQEEHRQGVERKHSQPLKYLTVVRICNAHTSSSACTVTNTEDSVCGTDSELLAAIQAHS